MQKAKITTEQAPNTKKNIITARSNAATPHGQCTVHKKTQSDKKVQK